MLAAGGLEVWAAEIAGGRRAVSLLNRAPAPANITASWAALGLGPRAQVRDVWAGADRGVHLDGYTGEVPAFGARLLVVAPAAEGILV